MAWIDTKYKSTGPRFYVCWRAPGPGDAKKTKIVRSQSYRDRQEVETALKVKEEELLRSAPPPKTKISLEVIEPAEKRKQTRREDESPVDLDKVRFTAYAYRKKTTTRDGRVKFMGRWIAGWRDERNVSRTKGGFLTKESAKIYARKKLEEVQKRVSGISPYSTGKDIQGAIDTFCSRPADRRGPICDETHELNRRHLDYFTTFARLKLVSSITKEDVTKWWNQLKIQGRNVGGQAFSLRIIHAFCNFCRKKSWLQINPFEDIAVPRGTSKGVYLQASPREKLLSHIDPRYEELDAYWCRVVQFGLYSCLRIGQVFNVDWSHFNAETGKLKVPPWKRQKERFIRLPPKAIEAMGELKSFGQVFDRWPDLERMRESFKKRAERLGMKGIRYHDTGHTMISRLLEDGYSLGEVQEYTGKSWTTIQQYSHAYKKHLEEKILTFDYPKTADAKA